MMLLRPDRYVAACIGVDDLKKGSTAVASLIAATSSP